MKMPMKDRRGGLFAYRTHEVYQWFEEVRIVQQTLLKIAQNKEHRDRIFHLLVYHDASWLVQRQLQR